MIALVTTALALLAMPALFASGYLLLMTLLSGRNALPPPSSRSLRFDIIVPAHDESVVIARVVGSLLAIDWPKDRFRVRVVADNCNDDTAARARAAGAEVLERHNAEQRGKGYALDHAFAASHADGWADALVVIDADAEVTPNLLEAFAARLERGAQVVQAHYGILNPDASWRTRLLTIAKAAFHGVRSRARERLGLSCGIRGNGWCIRRPLLLAVPFQSFSITEDLEYGIALGLAGYRVHYADEAHADADMVSGGGAVAARQRQRWEGGRFALIRSRTGALLRAAITRRSAICLDLACDLLVLPLSYVALNAVAFAAVAALGHGLLGLSSSWLWLALACMTSVVLYVLRGWQLSGTGAAGLLDLGRAPFFIAWKLLAMLRSRGSRVWVRTERDQGR